jgi:hypothetical protein
MQNASINFFQLQFLNSVSLRVRYCGCLRSDANTELARFIKWDRSKEKMAVMVISREGSHFPQHEKIEEIIRADDRSFFASVPGVNIKEAYSLIGPLSLVQSKNYPKDSLIV